MSILNSDSIASVVLIGATNVGKSSIFNRLTKSQDALVADEEHLTRDLRPGMVKNAELDSAFLLYDTAGVEFTSKTALDKAIQHKTLQTIEEADVILFVFDAQQGISAIDNQLIQLIRRANVRLVLVANKIDGVDMNQAIAEASELGITSQDIFCISALLNRGTTDLKEKIFTLLIEMELNLWSLSVIDEKKPSVVFCGRPNAGKSTLLNSITQKNRSIVSMQERSTRDEVRETYVSGAVEWQLIDTAGVFASWRTDRSINKLTAMRTLSLVESSNIAVVILDVSAGISKQDKAFVARAVQSGRAAIVALNKIDLVHSHLQKKMIAQMKIDISNSTEKYVEVIGISAQNKVNLDLLFSKLQIIYAQQTKVLTTSMINRVLEEIVKRTPPPTGRGNRRIKIKFANLQKTNPHVINLYGTQTTFLPSNYVTFLTSKIQQGLKITHLPIKIHFIEGDNPYAEKTNRLTLKQYRSRKRLIIERKSRNRY